MALINRISRLFKADFHAVLDHIEEPEALLKQAIRDMEDDLAKTEFLEQRPNHKKQFQRLKGLGEMDWQELRETTMDPDTRTLLQVTLEEAALADEVTSVLMGDDVASRREFITTNARDVQNLDF